MKTTTKSFVCLGALAALALAGYAWTGDDKENDTSEDTPATGRRNVPSDHPDMGEIRAGQARTARSRGGANGITYHGGPVMTNPIGVYLIYYGSAFQGTTQTIMNRLASTIGGSPYFNINNTYVNGSNVPVPNSVSLKGYVAITGYPNGTSLSDSTIQSIISGQIGAGKPFPSDPNSVYFLITDKTVNATSGFCTQYCGWHTRATISGTDIKYSFIGSPDRCPSGCSALQGSPNNNTEADAMASIWTHELEEAATDPDLNAWYDSRGYENADKCAWTFGTTTTTSNGAKANVSFGGYYYLIQQNWLNAGGGKCALQYP